METVCQTQNGCVLVDFAPSSGEGSIAGWEQDLGPPLAGAGEWWAVSLSDPVGPGRMGQELPLVMPRPPCRSWPCFIHSTLSDLAASLEALICSDRCQLTLGVLRQMGVLLLTTERAPVFFLSRLLSSRREPRRPVAVGRLVFPLEQECPQDSTIGFANQIKHISLCI